MLMDLTYVTMNVYVYSLERRKKNNYRAKRKIFVLLLGLIEYSRIFARKIKNLIFCSKKFKTYVFVVVDFDRYFR